MTLLLRKSIKKRTNNSYHTTDSDIREKNQTYIVPHVKKHTAKYILSVQTDKTKRGHRRKLEDFDVNSQWKPPGEDFLFTIHKIKWQRCSCCLPLTLLISEPNISNGQKLISELSKLSKKIVSLYNMLRLCTYTHPTEFDALLQFKGNQISGTAHSILLPCWHLQNNCQAILFQSQNDSPDKLILCDQAQNTCPDQHRTSVAITPTSTLISAKTPIVYSFALKLILTCDNH